jgi:drug/metabolite transporter (DMT)-like permease
MSELRPYVIIFASGVLLGCFRFLAARGLRKWLRGPRASSARATLGALFAFLLAAIVIHFQPSHADLGATLLLFGVGVLGYFGSLLWLVKQFRL